MELRRHHLRRAWRRHGDYDRLTRQKAPLELEMMARVRSLFDPQGLFNPGKVFDTQAHLPRAVAAE